MIGLTNLFEDMPFPETTIGWEVISMETSIDVIAKGISQATRNGCQFRLEAIQYPIQRHGAESEFMCCMKSLSDP